MKFILIILAIILVDIVVTYLCLKIVENLLNLNRLLDKNKRYNMSGMVLNTKTNKLEADNGILLPF